MRLRVYFLSLISIILVSGCTVSSYQGNYYFPENSVFDEANFKYVTTISGTSSAKWNILGLDKKKLPEGMAATAKKNMYSTYSLKPNQIITNISTEMVYSYFTFLNLFPLGGYTYTAIVSADVYEFSDNGEYNTSPTKDYNENTQTKNKTEIKVAETENNVSETTQIKSKEKQPGYYYNGKKCEIIETISHNEFLIKYATDTGRGFYKKVVKLDELEQIVPEF